MDKNILIRKYLYGELSESEYQEFEKLLETDSDFAMEVEAKAVIFADSRSKFKQSVEKAFKADVEPKHTAKNRTIFFYVKRVAAVLFIGTAFLIWQYTNQTVDEIVDSEYNESATDNETISTYLGGDNAFKKVWEDFRDCYNQEENRAKCPSILEGFNAKDIHSQYYLGVCYLDQDPPDYEKAINKFLFVIENAGKPQKNLEKKEYAEWYICIAYLKNGDVEKGLKYLKQLPEKHPKKKVAKKLIRKIERNIL